MSDNNSNTQEHDGVTIDLRAGIQGEKFTYKGYECRITNSGVTPGFTIDDDVISLADIEDVTGHAGRGMTAWKNTLKEYIDVEHDT